MVVCDSLGVGRREMLDTALAKGAGGCFWQMFMFQDHSFLLLCDVQMTLSLSRYVTPGINRTVTSQFSCASIWFRTCSHKTTASSLVQHSNCVNVRLECTVEAAGKCSPLTSGLDARAGLAALLSVELVVAHSMLRNQVTPAEEVHTRGLIFPC